MSKKHVWLWPRHVIAAVVVEAGLLTSSSRLVSGAAVARRLAALFPKERTPKAPTVLSIMDRFEHNPNLLRTWRDHIHRDRMTGARR